MDAFTILFIIIAGAGIFGFYSLVKYFYKTLKKNYNPPRADEFISHDDIDQLDSQFNQELIGLEAERERLFNKTKGLFKRSFLRTFFLLGASFIAIAGVSSEWSDPVGNTIGPLLMSAALAAIGAGIYTLVKKGSNSYKFSRMFKKELVSKIVKHVNPKLNYFDEGIDKAEFDKAALFPAGESSALSSEDKITGIIDGHDVLIAECEKRGRKKATVGRTKIKVGGKTLATSSADLDLNSNEFVTYFKGLFISIKLDGFDLASPIKFIADTKLKKEVTTGVQFDGYDQKYVDIKPEDKVEVPGEYPFAIFCDDQEGANHVLTEKVLKVADYIFTKYNKEGEKVFKGIGALEIIPVFKDLKYSKAIYLSIAGDRFYLALEWPEDMFETDAFLKENLFESGIAQKIYGDLLFIDQLIKEVNLMNKANI